MYFAEKAQRVVFHEVDTFLDRDPKRQRLSERHRTTVSNEADELLNVDHTVANHGTDARLPRRLASFID
jgi:hypothetical protein